jgi:hypothetical protein
MGTYALESPRALLAEMRLRRRGFSWRLVRLLRWGAETLCGAQWAGCQGIYSRSYTVVVVVVVVVVYINSTS